MLGAKAIQSAGGVQKVASNAKQAGEGVLNAIGDLKDLAIRRGVGIGDLGKDAVGALGLGGYGRMMAALRKDAQLIPK